MTTVQTFSLYTQLLLCSLLFCQEGHAEQTDAEITVESTDSSIDPSEGTATVSVIQIDHTQATAADLGQMIEQAPGVQVTSIGGLGDFAGVGLRGSTLRQTLVYLDGIPLNPDGASVVNLSELPPRAFSHIAVYRGLTPPTLPSASMGGVVHLHSRQSQTTHAQVSAGTWNTLRANLYHGHEVQTKWGPLHIIGFADTLTTEGNFTYFDDNGTPYNLRDDARRERLNNDKSQATGQLKLKLGHPSKQFSLFGSFLNREEGISGSIRLPAETARLETNRSLSAIDYVRRGSKLAFNGQLWNVHRLEYFDDRNSELGLGSQWNKYVSQSIGGKLQLRTLRSSRYVTTVSINPRLEHFDTRDQISKSGTETHRRAGGMLTAGTDIYLHQDKLHISPAFILSTLKYLEGDDRWYVHPSPRLGIRYSLNRWLSIRSTAGTYFRPPDMFELYGDRGFILGNPELRPEIGQQADIGTKLNWDSKHITGHLECVYFINPSSDRITYIQNSQFTQIAQNVGSAMVSGVETSFVNAGWDHFSQSTSLTWIQSQNKDNHPMIVGNPLPRLPEWELHTQQSFFIDRRFRLTHQWHYTSSNTWDAFAWFSSPPRHIHSAFIRTKLFKKGPDLELGVNNLTDNITMVAPRDGPNALDRGWSVKPIADYNAFPIAGRQFIISLHYTPTS